MQHQIYNRYMATHPNDHAWVDDFFSGWFSGRLLIKMHIKIVYATQMNCRCSNEKKIKKSSARTIKHVPAAQIFIRMNVDIIFNLFSSHPVIASNVFIVFRTYYAADGNVHVALLPYWPFNKLSTLFHRCIAQWMEW